MEQLVENNVVEIFYEEHCSSEGEDIEDKL
jgi:hypothetical protein